MIRGVVNDRGEIRIAIPVLDAAGFEQVIDAVLDTGFDDALALPHALIGSLQWPVFAEGRVRMADGRVEWIEFYDGTVVGDGVEREVEVHALEGDILIGMALLTGHDLRARVVIGGAVEIEAIP